MRRDQCWWAALVLTGMSTMAHGQKLEIHPSLETLATATTNASDTTADPRKDLVITVTPAVSASYVGARSRIDGMLKVDNVQFVRNSQPDRSLPSGNLLLHTDLVDQWGGLDASVDSRQMAANLLARESSTTGVTDSYTTTQFLVAPFIERSFNADTRLSARFERSITKSTEEAQGLQSRPDSHLSNYVVRLERQPVPLGGSLEWTYQNTQDSNNALTQAATQDASQLKESAVRGGVSYALNEQLHTGLILGRETIQVPNADSQSDTIKGVKLTWRPNERAALNSTVERRFFGTGWKVDWSHRLKFLTWSVNSERDASTYASAIAGMRALRQNASVDPSNGTGALLLAEPIAYSSSATVRQTLQARMVLMGQRNTVSFGGGMDKTVPLAIGTAPALGDQTMSSFFEAQFNRKLSPLTSLNTGVRWSKARITSNINPGANSIGSGTSRSVLWRGAISTILSAHATATFGLRHQTVDSTLPNVNDESAMFVGLGYRY